MVLRNVRSQRGVTLIELIVAVFIGGIMVVLVAKYFGNQNMTYQSSISLAEQRQGMRASVDLVQRELRTAGYDPTGMGFDGLVWDTTKLIIKSDLNGDGDLGDQDELIEYAYDEKEGMLTRRAYANGCSSKVAPAADVVTEYVAEFDWTFYDGNNSEVTGPGNDGRIRKVDVTLSLRNASVSGGSAEAGGNQRNSLNVTVVPRNMDMVALAPSDGDGEEDPQEDPDKDPVEDPDKDPVTDPDQDPVVDPDKDPVEDPVVDPDKDPVEDPVVDPDKDPVEDPVEDPVKDPIIDPDACCPCGAMANKIQCLTYRKCCGATK